MSWSVSASGMKDFVRETVAKQFDEYASGGMSDLEKADAVAARSRVFALIDGLVAAPQYNDNEIAVSAHGSHSTYEHGVGEATFSVKVGFTHR